MIYCVNKPPEHIEINGNLYLIDTDFFIWAIYFEDFINAIVDNEGEDEALVDIISKIKETFFVEPVNEPVSDILKAMTAFYNGYPEMCDENLNKETEAQEEDGEDEEISVFRQSDRILDFKVDLNLIILAIRNQSGINLTHQSGNALHWWDFLLEVESLTEEHKISKIMSFRGYTGKDKDLLRAKNYYKLPIRQTAEQKNRLKEIDDLFYNS